MGLLFYFFIHLIEFFKSQSDSHIPKALTADVQAVFIDVRTVTSAIFAFSQGDSATSFLRLIELDELSFLYWFSIKLLEYFSMVAGGHSTFTPCSLM